MSGEGAYLVVGSCYGCGAIFGFRPELVPSMPVRADGLPWEPGCGEEWTGRREPICRPCAEAINAIRAAEGMTTWTISDEAYEPAEGLP